MDPAAALDVLEAAARRDLPAMRDPGAFLMGLIRQQEAAGGGGRPVSLGRIDDRVERPEWSGNDRGQRQDAPFDRNAGGAGGDSVQRMLQMLVDRGLLPYFDRNLYTRLTEIPEDDALDVLEEVVRRGMHNVHNPIGYVIGMIRNMKGDSTSGPPIRKRERAEESDEDVGVRPRRLVRGGRNANDDDDEEDEEDGQLLRRHLRPRPRRKTDDDDDDDDRDVSPGPRINPFSGGGAFSTGTAIVPPPGLIPSTASAFAGLAALPLAVPTGSPFGF